MRAFSLIEAMVVVAILGIAAALAIPALLPEVHKAQLDGAAEGLANFVARVRAEAMLSKRCTRVTVTANELVAERFNTFDCESTNPAGPFIDNGVASPFIVFDRFKPESPNVSFPLVLPQFRLPTQPAGELRFRPNGRVFSQDNNFNNDDALVSVLHARIPAAQGNFRSVAVKGNGLICTFKRGISAGAGPTYTCP